MRTKQIVRSKTIVIANGLANFAHARRPFQCGTDVGWNAQQVASFLLLADRPEPRLSSSPTLH